MALVAKKGSARSRNPKRAAAATKTAAPKKAAGKKTAPRKAARKRARKKGASGRAGATRKYPEYALELNGPGIPTGAGISSGTHLLFGPHTCFMVPGGGRFKIELAHRPSTESATLTPDLIITFTEER